MTATVNGTGIDFRDCGPEVTAMEILGTNPGDDTTIDLKLQESSDNSTFSDISGATFTQVAGDTENQLVVRTFFNRAARYVRAVATVAGTSPVIQYAAVLGARKVSY